MHVHRVRHAHLCVLDVPELDAVAAALNRITIHVEAFAVNELAHALRPRRRITIFKTLIGAWKLKVRLVWSIITNGYSSKRKSRNRNISGTMEKTDVLRTAHFAKDYFFSGTLRRYIRARRCVFILSASSRSSIKWAL